MKNCECSEDIIHNNFHNAVQKSEKPKNKSSPKSVRSRPADRNVHDVTSTSSSITEREKHNHMLILDTVTETATGSVTHGDSGVQSQSLPIMLDYAVPTDNLRGPLKVYSLTTRSKPTSLLTAVKVSATLDPTCSPFTPAVHQNSYVSINNLHSINEFPNLPSTTDTAVTTASTTNVVPSNAGMTSFLSQKNSSRSNGGKHK